MLGGRLIAWRRDGEELFGEAAGVIVEQSWNPLWVG
jgi:hypothetical protein